MVFLEPLPDTNVIYVFHFYEPHIFTHQGATWGAYYWRWVKGLHYPSSPENAAQVAAAVPEAVNRLSVDRSGRNIGTPPAWKPKSIRPTIGPSSARFR